MSANNSNTETERRVAPEKLGAVEINAAIEAGDGNVDQGIWSKAMMHDVCDHVHVCSWKGNVTVALAPEDGGEIGFEMTPEQATAFTTALRAATTYATGNQDADVVLENGIAGDGDE